MGNPLLGTGQLNLYVTHMNGDGPLLRIYAQVDKEQSLNVERIMVPLTKMFAEGVGCPVPGCRLAPNVVCCAMFEQAYYRARIRAAHPSGRIVVKFIDYGNDEVLQLRDIRLLDDIPEALELQKIPPLALEFIIAGILPKTGTWERQSLGRILKDIRYNDYPAKIVSNLGNIALIRMIFDNQDFAQILVNQNVAISVSIEEQLRTHCDSTYPSHLQQPLMNLPIVQQQQQQQQVVQPGLQKLNSSGGERRQTTSLRTQRSQHYQENWRGQVQPNLATKINTCSQVEDSDGVFRTRILEIGTKHEVTVSYVEDGPLMFSVQVNSISEELRKLMYCINKTHVPQPIVEPPLIGFVCLGRYTADQSLRRAVVMQVREHDCKIHYVDYGQVEILPYTDIYQLPRQYINPRVLSLRFTMSNVNELNVTDEMKDYFKSYVMGKTLLLHVRPSEGSPLIQYGDLYDNDRNIKDILRCKFGDSLPRWPTPLKLRPDSREIAQVVYMNSSTIYVQLDRELPSLQAITNHIDRYVPVAPPLKVNQLRKGICCIALSTTDFRWYRAEIVDASSDTVTVFYVDYGNEETIPSTSVRSIRDDTLTKHRAQAIRCIINDYTELTTTELCQSLEDELMSKSVAMIVTKLSANEDPIVDLFDSETNPLVNLIERLKRASITNGNVDSGINPSRSNINRREEQTCKWNNSARSDNLRITESNNLMEKGRSNSWKEDENDPRRYDNRHQNRSHVGQQQHHQQQQQQQQQHADRFSRNDGPKQDRHDRFANDSNGNGRGGRDSNGGGRTSFGNSRFSGNNGRSERNPSADKSWSDKESDTSSKGSGKSGRRGSGGGRARRGGDRGSFKNVQRTVNGAASRLGRDNRRDSDDRNQSKRQMDNNWSLDDKTTEGAISSGKKVVIPAPNISVGAVKNCELVFMNNPTDFHVQLSPDNLELRAVMASMASTYEIDGSNVLESSSIQQGMDCVAQYSVDLKWYRATVESIETNNAGAMVRFVDYGNVEFVQFEKIKRLKAEYGKLSAQAIACRLLAASKSTWDESEIEQFGNVTEEKVLEAEFVAKESDIYEILLRQVSDNDESVTNKRYINDEFSNGADLTKAANNARAKARRGGQLIAAPTDYAPIDLQWSTDEPISGSKQNVIISWFTNPENFYCQRLATKDEFRTMMNDIQEVYASRKPINETLRIGSAVMAVFSDDGALYRAEILELNKPRGNIVRYVDFGNTAMVEPRNIYRVENKFARMPKQAIHCSLKNIVPANGSSWSRSNKQEIEKCFEADMFECTIHEIDHGDRCIISLSNEGVDVAGSMVDKKLASFAVSAIPPAIHVETNVTTQPEMEQLPRFDISLLAGQVLRVRVSNVASTAKFHIQLPSASASKTLIDSYMAEHDPKVMPRLSCREVCLGAGCLVDTDEGWRRAVVVNCSRTTGFDVRLIDTGANDEIPLDCMLALPGQLSVMQNQAVECCLASAKSSSSNILLDEKLRDTIENTNVIVGVEEVDNNRLIVKVYDSNGKGIKLSEDDADETICPVCPMPILCSTQKVMVCHADDSSSVWLKRTSDLDIDAELLGRMYDRYNASSPIEKFVVKPDIICAAKCSDGNWYRSKIIATSEIGGLVQFIDYGNTEDVSLECLRRLDDEFVMEPQLAVEVGLTVSLEGSKDQQREILKSHIVDAEFTATFYNVRKKWIAELTNEEGKMSERLGSLQAVRVLQNRQVLCEMSGEMTVGERYRVRCTHADSPALFWLQRNEELAGIEQLQEKVQIEAAINSGSLEGVPSVNTPCLAINSFDELWYRAVVVDADDDITSIRFIDYGNTAVVDTNSGCIKPISDSLKSIKSYAIKCRLDVIPYGGDDWMPKACEWFEGIVTSVENMEALVIADSIPRRVELFADDTSIVDELVKRNYATKIHTEEDLIEEFVDRELDPRAAYVSHAISPSEFWIQQEKYVGDLEVLADRLSVANMFPKLTNIEEGMLCVAEFPEDGNWYRARVVAHGDLGTEVMYIDYGNSAISTDLGEIPEDVAAQPPFSKKCRLELPDELDKWSEEACVEFVKMAADGATIFQLEFIEERQDTSVVRLVQEHKDIVEHLTTFCTPRALPIIEERLSPLGEEIPPTTVHLDHLGSDSRDFSTRTLEEEQYHPRPRYNGTSSLDETRLEENAIVIVDAPNIVKTNTTDNLVDEITTNIIVDTVILDSPERILDKEISSGEMTTFSDSVSSVDTWTKSETSTTKSITTIQVEESENLKNVGVSDDAPNSVKVLEEISSSERCQSESEDLSKEIAINGKDEQVADEDVKEIAVNEKDEKVGVVEGHDDDDKITKNTTDEKCPTFSDSVSSVDTCTKSETSTTKSITTIQFEESENLRNVGVSDDAPKLGVEDEEREVEGPDDDDEVTEFITAEEKRPQGVPIPGDKFIGLHHQEPEIVTIVDEDSTTPKNPIVGNSLPESASGNLPDDKTVQQNQVEKPSAELLEENIAPSCTNESKDVSAQHSIAEKSTRCVEKVVHATVSTEESRNVEELVKKAVNIDEKLVGLEKDQVPTVLID